MEWSTEHTNSIYGQADKLKMGRKTFKKHSRNSYLIGLMEANETIEKLIRDNPTLTGDELRGEIQLLMLEVSKKIQRNGSINFRRPSLERIVHTSTANG